MKSVIIVLFISIFIVATITPVIADDKINYIDISNANIEGNAVMPYQMNPLLNYFKIDYTLHNSNNNFILTFSRYAKPLSYSFTPAANCKELTTNFLFIFTKTDGYSCSFGNLGANTNLHIEFQNMATPFSGIFSFIGV